MRVAVDDVRPKPESRLWGPPSLQTAFGWADPSENSRDERMSLVTTECAVYTWRSFGVWRSWLARCVWDAEAPGSSPGTPTRFCTVLNHFGSLTLPKSKPTACQLLRCTWHWSANSRPVLFLGSRHFEQPLRSHHYLRTSSAPPNGWLSCHISPRNSMQMRSISPTAMEKRCFPIPISSP